MKRIIVLMIILNAIAFSLSAVSRYALVIGNGNYDGVYLRNPVNDANAIATTLRELDFYVILKTDLTKKQMVDAIRDFENRLTSEDVSLFYYSGHGVQVNGINYLIPLKANIISEKDVEFEAVALNRFMSNIEKAKMNIVILDACRDNPYKGTRSTSKGLAQVTSRTDGTFIAYATAPGNTASDGTGSNSTYTKHLIQEVKVPGQEIEDMFKNVRIAVKEETNNAQIPWDSSCLTDEFIFCAKDYTEPEESKNESKIEKENIISDKMVFVEGGTFQMGSTSGDSDEKPIHTVLLDDYYIGKYEVTQKEWKELMINNPSCFIGDDLPVEGVSWYDAVEFCNKKSKQEGLIPCYSGIGLNISCNYSSSGYRLPTEAEWEYAARGGKKSLNYNRSGSNNINIVAWYDGNSGYKTHKVGTKKPNELGIYDMSGNVWEWCNDWYKSNYYLKSSGINPRGPSSDKYRVVRGDGFNGSPFGCRVAFRRHTDPDNCFGEHGFRIVRTP